MKKNWYLLVFILYSGRCYSQTTQIQIRPAAKADVVSFDITEPFVTIEGYEGDNITIEALPQITKKVPEEALGLTRIPLQGRNLEQTNTLNPKVREGENDGHFLSISLPPCNCDGLLVKVPEGLLVSVSSQVFTREGKLTVRNIHNEVQVLGWAPQIELNRVSGFRFSAGGDVLYPANKIILSDIQWTDRPVIYNGKQLKMEYSLDAPSAGVYLYVPANLKATLATRSDKGEVYSDLNLVRMPLTDPQFGPYTQKSGKDASSYRWQLNNGGIPVSISTITGNIFLKTQK